MKRIRSIQQPIRPVAACLVLAASIGLSPAQDVTMQTFDADVGGWGTAWGAATATFDPAQDNTGNSGGAAYISTDYAADQNTITIMGNFATGGGPWNNSVQHNMSDFESLEFDVRWDTNSTVSIADFNANPGGDPGLAVWSADPGWSIWPSLGTVTIPEEAADGWVHISVPINPGTPDIDPSAGIMLKKWIPEGTSAAGGTVGFWVDNVILKAAPFEAPPPTVSLSEAISGLNITTTSADRFGRHSIRTVQTGYSFYGAAAPTTYSFTIKDYPGPENFDFQTHIFLVPNAPGAGTSAPDWNEPNVIWLNLQNGADGTNTLSFMHKTNMPNGNSMYFNTEPTNGPVGNLGELTTTAINGTWGMTFENDTSVTIFTPTSSMNIVLPADAAALFNAPLQAYFGAQPNEPANMGLSLVLDQISITGAVSSPDIADSFSSPPLDTNNWEISSSGPNSVRVLPSDAIYWLEWTLPDLGFTPEASASLVGGGWSALSTALLPGPVGRRALIASGDLPGADQGFWRLIKREVTRLQILLPGESPAPGTPTGKTGTPDDQAVLESFFVTVRAVDDEWNLVPGISHQVAFEASDGGANLVAPDPGFLSNGQGQFEAFSFAGGNFTITVTNLTDPSVLSDTSSEFTVN